MLRTHASQRTRRVLSGGSARCGRFAGAILLGVFLAANTSAYEELSDAELDAITAGSLEASAPARPTSDLLEFHFAERAAGGRHISGDGTVSIREATSNSQVGSMTITGGAQRNLSALVNINAVNSPVQVLLNLNLNIDSQIGTLTQLNLAPALNR